MRIPEFQAAYSHEDLVGRGTIGILNFLNAFGFAQGVAFGTATITASSAGVSGSTQITIKSDFIPTGSMSSVRLGHTATLLGNGQVLIAGGLGGGDFITSAELYNPVNGRFVPTGNLTAPRGGHTATLLIDGRVLLAGGNGLNGTVATGELGVNPKNETAS